MQKIANCCCNYNVFFPGFGYKLHEIVICLSSTSRKSTKFQELIGCDGMISRVSNDILGNINSILCQKIIQDIIYIKRAYFLNYPSEAKF